MDWLLELIVLPVADIDRAKEFYLARLGFGLDVDFRAGEDFRVVQLTPRGSKCSVALMANPPAAGSVQGLHLMVADLDAARAELVSRGVHVGEPFHYEQGRQVAGADPKRGDFESFFAFSDPDGNGWLVQEVPSRATGS